LWREDGLVAKKRFCLTSHARVRGDLSFAVTNRWRGRKALHPFRKIKGVGGDGLMVKNAWLERRGRKGDSAVVMGAWQERGGGVELKRERRARNTRKVQSSGKRQGGWSSSVGGCRLGRGLIGGILYE